MSLNRESREEVLRRLIAAGDALLGRVPALLQESDGAKALAKEAARYLKGQGGPDALKGWREEALARALASCVAMLDRAPAILQDTPDGGALAGEVDAYLDDVREYMASLVKHTWPPGEAPPGIADIQAELKEVEKEERKATRNKRKAAARKGGRRAN